LGATRTPGSSGYAKYDRLRLIRLELAQDRPRGELGIEVTAHHADYFYHDDGEPPLVPTTIVELPDGTSIQFWRSSHPAALMVRARRDVRQLERTGAADR